MNKLLNDAAGYQPAIRRMLTGVTILTCVAATLCPGASFFLPKLINLSEADMQTSGFPNSPLQLSVLTRLAHLGIRNSPTGEADLKMGWTDEGLKFGLEVIDANRLEQDKLYRGDSVEIFVSPVFGSPDYVQLIVAPGIQGSSHPAPRFQTVGYGAFASSPPQIEVTGGPVDSGYHLEILLPWRSLQLDPKIGQNLGVQVIINDRDVAYADTADYTKRNSEIDHICWFPDRTTAFDQTRMHQVILGEGRGEQFTTLTDLHVKRNRLNVYTPLSVSGRTLEVFQGERKLGAGKLIPHPDTHLATASLDLKAPQPGGDPLRMMVEGSTIDTVLLYRDPSGNESGLIGDAVETPDESVRLDRMRKLSDTTEDPLLQQDLQTLLPLVEIWAGGRTLAMEGRLTQPEEYLASSVNPMSPPAIRRDSPLFPVYALYRARNLIWRGIQGGETGEVKEYFGEARRLLGEAAESAPEQPLIQMYLGTPLPWPGPEPDPLAPQWANEQRNAVSKLVDIVHWWIEERQLPDGSYGGGWNDDVEMWRNWFPVLFAFEDPQAEQAQALLSNRIFEQPHMTSGYSSVMDDVEHSSEDSADTITPMLYLDPGAEVWSERGRAIARMMREVWTAKNERGNLMFKNIVMNNRGTRRDPKNAYDTTLAARAVQPAFVYWQMTHDPALAPQFTSWLDTWVDATADESNGKPAGVLPTAIHYPEQRPGGPNQWWKTEAFSFLYDWPQYTGDMLNMLAATAMITGEERYLVPIRSMADLRLTYLNHHPELDSREEISFASWGYYWKDREPPENGLEPGSASWCAQQMGSMLIGPLAAYRFYFGDTRYDEVLRRDGDGYMRFRLDGDRRALTEELASIAESFSSNRPAYTSEVRWTDRVFRFPSAYLESFLEEKPSLPNTRVLYASLTGDLTTWVGSRLAAVRWRTPPRDLAALVIRAGRDNFEAELFHFGSDERKLSADFPLLKPGRYEAHIETPGEHPSTLSRLELTAGVTGGHVEFTLPSRTLCRVRILPIH